MADVDSIAAHRGPFNFITDNYDCAVDPTRWSATLCKISTLVKGCAAAIIAYTPCEDVMRLQARWNISAKFEKDLIATAPLHPAVPAIWLLGIERPIITSAFFRDGRLARSLWHEKTMQPEGMRDAAIVPLTRTPRAFSALMIMRSVESGPYQPEDVATIATLAPHLQQAAIIAELLEFKSLTGRNSANDFDSTPVAIVLTDGRGLIVDVNSAGRRMLDGCALLCLDDGLAARDSASDIALRTAIVRAGRMHHLPAEHIELTSILVKGLGGAAPLAVWVMPISEHAGFSISGSANARVAIFARPLRTAERFPPEAYVQRNSIAVEDGRLLALLAQGLNLDEAAWALTMPMASAQASLARLLAKIHARDEADLVARMRGTPTLVSA